MCPEVCPDSWRNVNLSEEILKFVKHYGPTSPQLQNFHFFNLRNVLTRLLVEFRAMFFGANFEFLTLVLERYWAACLFQSLIANDARLQRISLPSAGKQSETKSQRDMLEFLYHRKL
jgi:hypothetical protein